VVGQDQKQLGGIVVPSPSGFAVAGIGATDMRSLIGNPETSRMIREEVRRLVGASSGFKPFERIATMDLLEKPFEVGDELTMTFKLKRHVIAEKYDAKIMAMFGN